MRPRVVLSEVQNRLKRGQVALPVPLAWTFFGLVEILILFGRVDFNVKLQQDLGK